MLRGLGRTKEGVKILSVFPLTLTLSPRGEGTMRISFCQKFDERIIYKYQLL